MGTIAAIGFASGIFISVLAAPATAQAKPLFCVLVPHFKDEYWLSVGFGLEAEAARQDVDLLFFEAGGYRARSTQIDQLDACLTHQVDAILIGAVTSDHPELTKALADVAQKVPVFGLVNALHSDVLSGRIGVDWHDMGRALGHHLSRSHPEGSPPKTAVLISGPPQAGWTGPLETGLRNGLTKSAVSLLHSFGADTGLRQQLALVEQALEQNRTVDYLIGSAPAVEAAIGYFATRPDAHKPLLLATYVSHSVKRGLMNGNVVAASFDDPMLQARMAIRQAASVMPQSVRRIGPRIVILTNKDKNLEHVSTSPADYFPAIQ